MTGPASEHDPPAEPDDGAGEEGAGEPDRVPLAPLEGGLRLSVVGLRRPGTPARALVLTVSGLDPVHTADDVDPFSSALLAAGFDLVTHDWAGDDVGAAPGWAVEASSGRLRLLAPGGDVLYEGPWTAPDGWFDLEGGHVALLAAIDVDLHTPVRSLDNAVDEGRLVSGRAELRRLPETEEG